jgi:tetratricopeptide (TPR) repeat protein
LLGFVLMISPRFFSPSALFAPRALLSCLMGTAVLSTAAPVLAQQVTSREVVQALPSAEVQRLNRALMQLARDQRDLGALLEAGEASLAVDDFDAATGFFARAEAVAADNKRALLGLARVYLRSGDAPLALDQFDKVVAAGVPADEIIAERALALDLVGDQARAQADYLRALELAPSDYETRRRLALSFAVSGNRAGFEDTLRPLLDQRDIAALRTRAFGLAILGDQDRAAAIVEQAMPRELSSRLIPYLAFMPRLTKPQQVAAANLGIFPRAADIGRDDPRLARFASETKSDSRLQPSGTPLGTPTPATTAALRGASPSQPGVLPSNARRARRTARRTRSVMPVPQPPAAQASVPQPPTEQPLAPQPPAPQPAALQTPQPIPADSAAAAPAAASPSVLPPSPVMSSPPQVTEIAGASGMTTPLPAQPSPTAVAVAAPPPRVADAFADLTGALPDPKVGTGAVDISQIEPPREVERKPEPKPDEAKPEAKPKPKEPPKPVHPSRYWVQIATGRDVDALRFDWRRFDRQAGDLFKGLTPHVVRWGQANRLLVGPVASREKAADLVRQLKAKGFDSFSYISPEGEQIQLLK